MEKQTNTLNSKHHNLAHRIELKNLYTIRQRSSKVRTKWNLSYSDLALYTH